TRYSGTRRCSPRASSPSATGPSGGRWRRPRSSPDCPRALVRAGREALARRRRLPRPRLNRRDARASGAAYPWTLHVRGRLEAADRGTPMGSRRTAVAVGTVAALLFLGAPAAAKGGEVGGSGSSYHLTDGWNARTDRTFAYGRAGDRVYVGDWNGDDRDTLAVRRGATYYFSDSLSGGAANRVVTYGRAGDTVLMGDWDGDGVDTPVVRRGNVYTFQDGLRDGAADRVVAYGRAGDQVLVGDWNGDGKDTLGVRRGSVYHLKNSLDGGKADHVVPYGKAGDAVLVGDWNGD